MIRVLQCVNNMHRAGLETMLMNYYRSMDRTRLQFDFLTHRPEKATTMTKYWHWAAECFMRRGCSLKTTPRTFAT
ncbi:MAG: hypothetical protein LUH04_16695 [Clostridium sp.]|nr:hypothetical protein [Clostridium sp.]